MYCAAACSTNLQDKPGVLLEISLFSVFSKSFRCCAVESDSNPTVTHSDLPSVSDLCLLTDSHLLDPAEE